MKTDVHGCSTCAPGSEQWEEFTFKGKKRVQYDYRTPGGTLFSCVAPTLEEARGNRDRWLEEQSRQKAIWEQIRANRQARGEAS